MSFGSVSRAAIGQLASRHIRHDDVGEQERGLLALVEHAQRLRRTRGLDDAVAELPQGFDGERAHALIVLDNEDDLAAQPSSDAREPASYARRLRGFAVEARQVDLDRRPDPELGIDFHMAAGLANEAVHLAQSEAGALAGAFGREERVESPAR